MKKIIPIFVFSLFMLALSCKKDKQEAETSEEPQVEASEEKNTINATSTDSETVKLSVALEPKSGSTASGNVIFKQDKGVVTMVAILSGLSEGTHAIHLHESADCSAEDGTSTGGHWNPTKEKHGKWGDPEGFHKGDIGNFTADANGNGTITFITPEWCIGCGDPLKDILGKDLINLVERL